MFKWYINENFGPKVIQIAFLIRIFAILQDSKVKITNHNRDFSCRNCQFLFNRGCRNEGACHVKSQPFSLKANVSFHS